METTRGWDGSLSGDLAVRVDDAFHVWTRIGGNKYRTDSYDMDINQGRNIVNVVKNTGCHQTMTWANGGCMCLLVARHEQCGFILLARHL